MKPLTIGARPGAARAAVVLLHGRGGSAEDMLGLAAPILTELAPDDRAALAWTSLRAPGGSWYPYGFMEPLARNQPQLDDALASVSVALDQAVADGVPRARVVLLGFSQGACLALEHAARNPSRLGGVIGLSGGLIGPDGTKRGAPGDLDGTPVFLGCSDRDPHIPERRVRESGEVLAALGGEVVVRIYPGMGHTVITEEIEAAAAIVARALAPDPIGEMTR